MWLDFFLSFFFFVDSIPASCLSEIWSIWIEDSHFSYWIRYYLKAQDVRNVRNVRKYSSRSVWSINQKPLGIVFQSVMSSLNCVIANSYICILFTIMSWETFMDLNKILNFFVYCIFLIFQLVSLSKKENEFSSMSLFLSQPMVMITVFFSSCLQITLLTISSEFLPENDVKHSNFQKINTSFSEIETVIFPSPTSWSFCFQWILIYFSLFKEYSTHEKTFNKEMNISTLVYNKSY